MTLGELNTLLKATGYPVAYSHFVETNNTPIPNPPYITYLANDSSNFIADNKVYKKINNITIELYTDKKELVAEGKLESILDANEIAYQSYETYIETEKLFQKIYEVRL